MLFFSVNTHAMCVPRMELSCKYTMRGKSDVGYESSLDEDAGKEVRGT